MIGVGSGTEVSPDSDTKGPMAVHETGDLWVSESMVFELDESGVPLSQISVCATGDIVPNGDGEAVQGRHYLCKRPVVCYLMR